MASSLLPDVRFSVLPTDYLAALAVDAERWEAPASRRSTAWTGRRVWVLLKDTEERAYWRLFAFNAEREYVEAQARTAALVAAAIAGGSYRSSDVMLGVACERIVEVQGYALTVAQYDRVIIAVRELWSIAASTVDTELGDTSFVTDTAGARSARSEIRERADSVCREAA